MVLIRMRDMVTQSTDANGNVTFTKTRALCFPRIKSLSSFLSTTGATTILMTEKAMPIKPSSMKNGDVKCQYTDASGNVSVGDYDVVPRMNTFLKEHPDRSL